MRRILFLAQAEVLHIVRDRATLAQMLVVPIVQLLVLSNAATFEIRDTPTYVVDLDRTASSRGLVDRFAASRPLPHRRAVGLARPRRTRRCSSGDVTLVADDPGRLRASLVRTGAAPVQLRQRRERLGGGHRPVVCRRGSLSSAPARPSSQHGGSRGRAAADRRPRRGTLVQPDAELHALHGARDPRGARDDHRDAAHARRTSRARRSSARSSS